MKKGLQTLSNHVKQGDMVKIISGKDKGKIGEITKVIKNENRVVVKEVNVKAQSFLFFTKKIHRKNGHTLFF